MSAAPSDRDRGDAHYLAGRYQEAVACYQSALRSRPVDVDALNNLGAALADLGRADEAIACYERAIGLQPRFAEAHYNFGNVLRLSGRLEQAIDRYATALRIRPELAEGHINLGIALRKLGRRTEAQSSLRRSLELRPGAPSALVSLGLTLADSGRLAEAIGYYGEALGIDPGNPDAHHDRALARLLLGDWTRGWPEYDWRWRCAEFRPPRFAQPPWDGSPLDGRTIRLYAEQGFGDTLQFVRYATLVRGRGGRVVLEAPDRLHAILEGVEGIDLLVSPGGAPDGFDVHYPLMSLPQLFGTTPQTVPAPVPYLHAEPSRVARWRQTLEPVTGLRVGIAWRGNPAMLPYDRRRSIPLDRFEPLARLEGVQLISLQVGPGAEEVAEVSNRFPVFDYTRTFDESSGAFLDSAALIASLDLVICCDSAIAHLAGSLAASTWIALPETPDWRWLLDRDDSPWYPTARLFRQTVNGRWDDPIDRMARAIRERLARGGGRATG